MTRADWPRNLLLSLRSQQSCAIGTVWECGNGFDGTMCLGCSGLRLGLREHPPNLLADRPQSIELGADDAHLDRRIEGRPLLEVLHLLCLQ